VQKKKISPCVLRPRPLQACSCRSGVTVLTGWLAGFCGAGRGGGFRALLRPAMPLRAPASSSQTGPGRVACWREATGSGLSCGTWLDPARGGSMSRVIARRPESRPLPWIAGPFVHRVREAGWKAISGGADRVYAIINNSLSFRVLPPFSVCNSCLCYTIIVYHSMFCHHSLQFSCLVLPFRFPPPAHITFSFPVQPTSS
jgi:hypothetical protein